MRIECLDHGYVSLIDHMGTDATIVQAARCSIAGAGVKAVSDDETLIRYLMRNRHTTPFEAVTITTEWHIPIFVARQAVRHRTQALNEMSARYGELPEVFYVPKPEDIQHQAGKNKQGRDDAPLEHAAVWADRFAGEATRAFEVYHHALEDGMARELARIDLPLSTYTKWWSTMSLHNAFHFLGLRKSPHAQMEIRVFADAFGKIIESLFPIAYRAFEDYQFNALRFSKQELQAIAGLFSDALTTGDIVVSGKLSGLKGRELDEFIAKIASFV